MKKSKLTTKQIVLTGMMTAVLAVLSIVTIPLPTGVPVTLQTFAMALRLRAWLEIGRCIVRSLSDPRRDRRSGLCRHERWIRRSSRTGRRLYFRIYSDGNALRCRN